MRSTLKPSLFRCPRSNSPPIVLDPIPTAGLTAADVDELARTTRELMLKELVALTEKAQGRPMAMAVPAQTDLPAPPPVARTSSLEKPIIEKA